MAVPSAEKPPNQASSPAPTDADNEADSAAQAESEKLEKGRPDFGLQVGIEEILVDVDPKISLEFLKKANALAGRPPPHRTPRDKLVATHVDHVQKSTQQREAAGKKQTRPPRMVKKVILALSYAPSARPIRELTTMPLADLVVENHHEDKMLIVRTITPVYQGAGVVAIVEDEWGNAEKLAVYNQPEASIFNTLPQGSVLLVKEPYYKYSGGHDFMICIDHPSDVRLLRQGPDEALIPEAFRTPEKFETAAQWGEAGDRAFVARDLPLAKASYTRALQLAPPADETFKRGTFAKRAGVNLAIKCYDDAVSDALASRSSPPSETFPSDWKPYFVAARAAYELADFESSNAYFTKSLECRSSSSSDGASTSAINDIHREHDRCVARLAEAVSGAHDWASISRTVTTKNIRLDLASYIRKTEVRSSPHHGRGIFATTDIKAGELIYAEKATCVPNEFNPEHNSAAAYAQLVELCANNPSVHAKVLGLYGGSYKRAGHEGDEVDIGGTSAGNDLIDTTPGIGIGGNANARQPAVDVYLLESIRRKNCFSGTHVSAQAARPTWSVWKQGMSRGLWVYSAHSNHACRPNSNRSFVGDMLLSTAAVDIPAGTEVTQVYLPPKASFPRRVDQYRGSWGFVCDCALCEGERGSPREAHERRAAMLGRDIEPLLKKKAMNPRVYQSDAAIRGVEKLAGKLEALHERDVYEGIPRLLLVWPAMWALEAWRTRKRWNKVVRWALEALRDFGFVNPLRDARGEKTIEPSGDGRVVVEVSGDDADAAEATPRLWVYERQNAITTFETVKALKWLEEAWRAIGEDRLAAQAREKAMVSLKVMVGFVTEQTYSAFH